MSLSELLSVFIFKQVESLLRCQPFLQTLKEKGEEAYTSSAALTVPGHVSTHRL